MNKEEAIKIIKFLIDRFMNIKELKHDAEAMQTVLNYIEKLENMYNKEHNEHMEMKRQNSVLRNNERILKEKIEELEKKNKDLCENYCPKYKELEEKLKIQTENYNSAYEDINWFCDKYIPKQKIKELKEKIHNTLDNNGITRAYQIKIDEYFEELLEEEK